MTIESPATYINQLNASYPEGGADRSTADDHLRLIKATVKATFPAITGPVTVTHTELNLVAGATKTLASVSALTVKYSLSISANAADIARISQTVSVLWAKVTSISALNTQYSLSIVEINASLSAMTTSLNSVSVVVTASLRSVSAEVIASLRSVSVVLQPRDAELTAIAGLTSAANKVPRFTGSGTAEVIDVAYGTYTPTFSSLVNLDSVTVVGTWQYIRVGNIVSVSGKVDADATAASSTATSFRATVPVASDFSSNDQAHGNFSTQTAPGGTVNSASGTQLLSFNWGAGSTGSARHSFSAHYEII